MQTNKTNDKIIFIITFLLMCCSQDTLFFGTNENERVLAMAKLLPFVELGVLLFLTPRFTMRSLCLLAVMAIVLLASCYVNKEPLNNYAYRIAIIGCACMLMEGHSEKFWEYFKKILKFLCIWSIATFVLVIVVPQSMNWAPSVNNYGGFKYANFIFSVVPFDSNYGVARNHLLFREPGVAVVILTIAIINELKKNTELDFKELLLYFVTMLTTMSTAGMIIMLACVAYILFVKKEFAHRGMMFVLAGISVVLILNTTNLLDSESAIWTKFTEGSNSYGSWYSRLSSLTENISIAARNPVFGIGRYHLYDVILAEEGGYVAECNTNTVLINFAAFGIAYGMLHLIGLLKYAARNEHGYLRGILVFLILFMALSNEDMGQNVVYYALIFSGFSEVERTKDENCLN